jgi:hypothetical protein
MNGYTDEAAAQLDRLQVQAPEPLWNAIVDALNRIFDRPAEARARCSPLVGRRGQHAWKYDVVAGDDAATILWRIESDKPFGVWAGAWAPQ